MYQERNHREANRKQSFRKPEKSSFYSGPTIKTLFSSLKKVIFSKWSGLTPPTLSGPTNSGFPYPLRSDLIADKAGFEYYKIEILFQNLDSDYV